MKKLILYFSAIVSATAMAGNFSYSCKSQNQAWTAVVTLNEQELIIPGYQGRKAVYQNKGFNGGYGNMADKYRYILDMQKSFGVSSSEKGSIYYVSKELLAGGRHLSDGSIGGYIFSRWENNDYLKCIRN